MGSFFSFVMKGRRACKAAGPTRQCALQRLRLESLLRPELLPDSRLLLLPLPLLLREDDPSSLLPPRWRLLSDPLRDEPLPLRDELLLEPDDLLDCLAICISSGVSVCADDRHSKRLQAMCHVAYPLRSAHNARAWRRARKIVASIGKHFRRGTSARMVLQRSEAWHSSCDRLHAFSQTLSTKEHTMAKSKSGSSKSQPLAIELLMSDHRKVEDLFEQYESEKDADEDTRRGIAQQICNELTVHAQVEEELLYPWLRENLDDEEMVEEAQIEHNTAKDLIAQIESADAVDTAFNAKVKVLSEYIKHHVKEEENEIFPEVRDEKEELDELGQEIAARKGELMEELGIAAEAMEEGEETAQAGSQGRERSQSNESTQRRSR
jgi:hemerythrin superfamily protein